MRWQLERLSEPEIEPVTLAEMKVHLREYVSVTTRDDEITELTKAAREWVEDYTARILIDQTWRLSVDRTGDLWLDPANTINVSADDAAVTSPGLYLRRSPILAVASVVTVDSDGDETEVAASEYELRAAASKFPFLVPTSTATWASANLRVTFRAGFADLTGSPQDDASVVPARFKQAIKLWTQAHYEVNELSARAIEIAENLIKSESGQVGFA